MLRATIVACLAVAGCGGETAVYVVVDAQAFGRATGAELLVRAFGPDGEVDPTPAEWSFEGGAGFPRVIRLAPRGGDASRRWALRALLRDGSTAALIESQIVGSFVPGERRFALLCLEDACFGQACSGDARCDPSAPGASCQGCADGECTLIEAELLESDRLLGCPTAPPEIVCTDGADDDLDGAIDCDDIADCEGRPCDDQGSACVAGECVCLRETSEIDCGNGLDDDCDAAIDCDDSECNSMRCESDGRQCTQDVCVGRDCMHPFDPNGTSCGDRSTEVCCGGRCTWMGSQDHCGGCGQDCGGGTCIRITRDGRGRFICGCSPGDPDCPNGQICERPSGTSDSRCQCENNDECSVGGCIREPGEHNYCTW